ncbi:YHYH domain-containing protein [Nisaea sp.]|uniref:YHYH domain-containing protein n=1 Tax=Nisaea sp. TaxID=2024842 RepID=UPI003B5201E0
MKVEHCLKYGLAVATVLGLLSVLSWSVPRGDGRADHRVVAHSGATDSNGCHNSSGGWHCH